MEITSMEDDLNERQPQWKTNSMENNQAPFCIILVQKKKKEKRKKKRLKDGNNNGQLRNATPPRVEHAKPTGPKKTESW